MTPGLRILLHDETSEERIEEWQFKCNWRHLYDLLGSNPPVGGIVELVEITPLEKAVADEHVKLKDRIRHRERRTD